MTTARMREMDTKNLLKLRQTCIPREEVARFGKRAVADFELLVKLGFARIASGEEGEDFPECYEITEAGEAALKRK